MHPGFFSVARKAFLETQRALYNAAYEIGDAKNCIANVFRRYCKRFPRTLPEDVDPSQEELEAVRDDEADEEDNDDNLDLSSYPEEERAKILEARAVEARAIKKLKAVCVYLFLSSSPNSTNPLIENSTLVELSLHQGPRCHHQTRGPSQRQPFLSPLPHP